MSKNALLDLPECPRRWWDELPDGWELTQSRWDSSEGWIFARRAKAVALFRFEPEVPGSLMLVQSAPSAKVFLQLTEDRVDVPESVLDSLEWEIAGEGLDTGPVKVRKISGAGVHEANVGEDRVYYQAATQNGALEALAKGLYERMQTQINLVTKLRAELRALKKARLS